MELMAIFGFVDSHVASTVVLLSVILKSFIFEVRY